MNICIMCPQLYAFFKMIATHLFDSIKTYLSYSFCMDFCYLCTVVIFFSTFASRNFPGCMNMCISYFVAKY